jgi:conjugative transfer signal peptidase TraF
MQAKQLNLVPLYVMLFVLSAVATIAIIGKSFGIVLNATGSMPDTIYKLGKGEKGGLVSFCSPTSHPTIGRGSCPDGSMPLIKRVVGIAGDLVTATDHGVEINGHPVANSRPLDLDTEGRALPHLRGFFGLKQGEIWAAGEHPNSFDSRYFGPVKFARGDHNMTPKSPSGFVK